ncbi:MAG: hypothetical protein FJ271_14230 [Planctomycetes bacterium]|nr:hypothetical protein [Planctomycetota bacterium]
MPFARACRRLLLRLVVLASVGLTGCQLMSKQVDPTLPNEKAKIALPPYVIEPPDVLQINAVQLVPKPPYKIKPFDVILVQFPSTGDILKKEDLEDLDKAGRRIGANFVVEPEGYVNLGPVYGNVPVAEMTIDKAREAVTERIKMYTKKDLVEAGKVRVELVQSRAMQQVLGDHLVRLDGTVGLGT